MLIEAMLSAALGGALYGYVETKRKKKERLQLSEDNKERMENINRWKKCLSQSGVQGIKNKNNDTFELYAYKKTQYGFIAKTKAPMGCDWSKLRDAVGHLETEFSGMVEVNKSKYDENIDITVVTEKPRFTFKPIKTKSCDELFVMLKASGKPVFIDLSDNPHVIFSGKSGSGKTFVEFMSITNMLYNYKNDFDMYICQIINGETKIFSKCKPVKMVADTLEEAVVLLSKLSEICDKREKELSKYGYISTKHWNKDNPRRKFKRIILLMDEFSFFKVEDGDTDEDKKAKLLCEKYFKRIGKAGRAMGVSLIAVTQKMSSENINTTLRSQTAVVSLVQHNTIDSNMAIGTSEAVNLEKLEAIIMGQGIYEKGYVGVIEAEQPQLELVKYVPEIIIPQKLNIKESWDNRLTVEETNALRTSEERTIIQYSKDELEERKERKKKSEFIKGQNKEKENDKKGRSFKNVKGA